MERYKSIFEDAYGERTIKKIFTKDLEQELKEFKLIKNKENE